MGCIQEWFEIKDIGHRIVESTGEYKPYTEEGF
jgi:hypothetical protein